MIFIQLKHNLLLDLKVMVELMVKNWNQLLSKFIFLIIKVRHNFTIINGRLAYIPQYGGEVTTTAKQHKKVPNAVGVSQIFHFTQHIENYSNSVSHTTNYQEVKTYIWNRFF